MTVLRAKTLGLRQTKALSPAQQKNSLLNEEEAKEQFTVLKSSPRRLVFEMTNNCNLNCKMCGRNAATFTSAYFDKKWLKKIEPIVENVEEVTLMGWGEPTVHPDFEEILNWADEKNLRKYFCTNGMKLGEIHDLIFQKSVDIIAMSLDGADAETNNEIRRGMDFDKVLTNLKAIVKKKKEDNLQYPYMNFVFTAMKSNLHHLPDIIKLAADVGLEEVKVVYLTVFEENLIKENLFNSKMKIAEVFQNAIELAEKLGVTLKLPHLIGEDPAGDAFHKTCYTAWRDLFIGSDGYVRACMSTSEKLFHIDQYDSIEELWNAKEFQEHRARVNCADSMSEACKNCYQSSFANWNREKAFVQIDNSFSPKWEANE